MSYQAEISYWLKNKEEGDVHILSTPATKIPEVGEKIYISNDFDEEWARTIFPNDSFFPKKEERVSGDFKVVSIGRYVTTRYIVGNASDLLGQSESIFRSPNVTAGIIKIPKPITTEVFEVFLEEIKK